jgi:hypothetical protein
MQSRFNTLVKTHHIAEMAPLFSYFDEIKYGNLNYDAIWKWSGILDAFYKIYGETPEFDQCIDIGGGLSPIHLIMSNYGKVKNVDDCSHTGGKFSGWFPVDEDNVFYEESSGFHYNKENIEYVNSDFIKFIETVPDNSVDLYVDGCSLIHVGPCANHSFHDGVGEVAYHMNRTLKSGGHFISTCDIYNPKLKENYPNLLRWDGITYPEPLFKVYSDSGLVPVDECDYEVEEFYKNYNNRVVPTPDAPFHKRLHPLFSQNKHLPDYHAFSQIQDFPMLIARFVFKKP